MVDLKLVGYTPHVRSKNSTIISQVEVFVALLVLAGFGVYVFGMDALMVLLASTFSAFLTEIVFNLFRYRKLMLTEISSLVVGLSLGLTLPAQMPFYFAIIGAVVSVLFIKLACGGLGRNFVSEVAFGKILVAIMLGASFVNYLGEGSALVDLTHSGIKSDATILELLLGGAGGTIGEINIVLIAVLGVVLCIFGAIDCVIPFFFLASFLLLGVAVVDLEVYLQFIACSGVVFVAFFVATDLGSSPNTTMGKALFGVICGLLTCVIWKFGNYRLAPYFAVLITELIFSAFGENFKPKFAGFHKEKR